MDLPSCLILTFAAGVIVGIVACVKFWIGPLRCEREEWRKAALDSEQQLEWEHTDMVRVSSDAAKWSKK